MMTDKTHRGVDLVEEQARSREEMAKLLQARENALTELRSKAKEALDLREDALRKVLRERDRLKKLCDHENKMLNFERLVVRLRAHREFLSAAGLLDREDVREQFVRLHAACRMLDDLASRIVWEQLSERGQELSGLFEEIYGHVRVSHD